MNDDLVSEECLQCPHFTWRQEGETVSARYCDLQNLRYNQIERCPRIRASLEGYLGNEFTGKDASHLMKSIPRMHFDGELLLDVGAGKGESSIPYSKAGLSVVSLDTSRQNLSMGVESGNITRGMAVAGDGRRLPFRKGAFDIVASRWFLHQFKGARQFLLEMKRVVKASGEVVCVDFCALTETMRRLWNTCLSPGEHILTKEEFYSLWLSLGLKIREEKWYIRPREQKAEELWPCLSDMKQEELQELRNVFEMRPESGVTHLVIPVVFLRAHIDSPSSIPEKRSNRKESEKRDE